MPGFPLRRNRGIMSEAEAAERERRLTELGLMLKTGKDPKDPQATLEGIDAELALHLRGKRGRKERREDETLWYKRLNVWLDTRVEVMRSMGHQFADIDWRALGIETKPLSRELQALEQAAAEVESPRD